MSKIFVKLINKCTECPNISLSKHEPEIIFKCCATNKEFKFEDAQKIQEWCPLEDGEAINIINKCESCSYAVYNEEHIDIWCSLSHKYILKNRNHLIPDWCILKVKEK